MRAAMILAAGRGERMRPLTDRLPKPLVTVNDKPLIVYHIERLAAVGVVDIVVNHAHLGEQIESALGDGSQWGVNIVYSPEPAGGLETAGGIIQALPLLGSEPFIVVNGDVWTDYDFARLIKNPLQNRLAHLVMVDNPAHKTVGDFYLSDAGELNENNLGQQLTFAGISLLTAQLFDGLPQGMHALAPVFRQMIHRSLISGEYHRGDWDDIGTIERLDVLRLRLKVEG